MQMASKANWDCLTSVQARVVRGGKGGKERRRPRTGAGLTVGLTLWAHTHHRPKGRH